MIVVVEDDVALHFAITISQPLHDRWVIILRIIYKESEHATTNSNLPHRITQQRFVLAACLAKTFDASEISREEDSSCSRVTWFSKILSIFWRWIRTDSKQQRKKNICKQVTNKMTTRQRKVEEKRKQNKTMGDTEGRAGDKAEQRQKRRKDKEKNAKEEKINNNDVIRRMAVVAANSFVPFLLSIQSSGSLLFFSPHYHHSSSSSSSWLSAWSTLSPSSRTLLPLFNSQHSPAATHRRKTVSKIISGPWLS